MLKYFIQQYIIEDSTAEKKEHKNEKVKNYYQVNNKKNTENIMRIL